MLLQAGGRVDLQSKEGGDAPSGWGWSGPTEQGEGRCSFRQGLQWTYRARRGEMLLQAGAGVDLQSKVGTATALNQA